MANIKKMTFTVTEDNNKDPHFILESKGFTRFELLGFLERQKHEILNDLINIEKYKL